MSNRMNEALRVLARRGKMLREQAESPIDYDHPADVEPEEEVWAGGDNIELQLDIANVQHGADEQVTEPEVMDITELRKFVREQIGKGSNLPTQEFARNQDSFKTGSIPMETVIEELIDVGWVEGDVHIMEQVYDYIEDEGILDINDITLGAAGLGPDSGYELQYHGPVTIEEYMGDAPSGGMDPRGLGIREAHGDAHGATTPEAYADLNGLQLELDNEGQKIIYLSTEQAERLDMPADVNWTADSVGGGWVIYTGEYHEEAGVWSDERDYEAGFHR